MHTTHAVRIDVLGGDAAVSPIAHLGDAFDAYREACRSVGARWDRAARVNRAPLWVVDRLRCALEARGFAVETTTALADALVARASETHAAVTSADERAVAIDDALQSRGSKLYPFQHRPAEGSATCEHRDRELRSPFRCFALPDALGDGWADDQDGRAGWSCYKRLEDANEPIVVFSVHRAPIDHLGTRDGWATITGDTPAAARTEIEARFQRGELRGVAATIQAGGVAITLTRAHRAVFVDQDWTPALNAQAEDRICRIGQDRGVIITRIIADHALDRRIAQVLATKIEIIEGSVDAAATNEPDMTREDAVCTS
jgi:hypothetical protein